MAYTTHLVKDVTGFIGWLPYDVLGWDLSQDKLLAKEFFKSKNMQFPTAWTEEKNGIGNFVLKSKGGSFGYQVAGPYRDSTGISQTERDTLTGSNTSTGFIEQFIEGTNLKVWFWGSKAIYAQYHFYPSVTGDGALNIQALIAAQFANSGYLSASDSDQRNIAIALKFQHLQHTDVLHLGRKVWLDFRYGRRYLPPTLEAESDSDLGSLDPNLMKQIDHVGDAVGEEALSKFKTPVLYSVDGVVDEQGQIWWLEINSNPMLPPEGYTHIFKSLFGLSDKSVA